MRLTSQVEIFVKILPDLARGSGIFISFAFNVRRERNRASAFRSRQRKKEEAVDVTTENENQKKEILSLKRKLENVEYSKTMKGIRVNVSCKTETF